MDTEFSAGMSGNGRDFDRELERLLIEFREKQAELNSVNDEIIQFNATARELHAAYSVHYDAYVKHRDNSAPLDQRMAEVRSELMDLQTLMIDTLIECLLSRKQDD